MAMKSEYRLLRTIFPTAPAAKVWAHVKACAARNELHLTLAYVQRMVTEAAQ